MTLSCQPVVSESRSRPPTQQWQRCHNSHALCTPSLHLNHLPGRRMQFINAMPHLFRIMNISLSIRQPDILHLNTPGRGIQLYGNETVVWHKGNKSSLCHLVCACCCRPCEWRLTPKVMPQPLACPALFSARSKTQTQSVWSFQFRLQAGRYNNILKRYGFLEKIEKKKAPFQTSSIHILALKLSFSEWRRILYTRRLQQVQCPLNTSGYRNVMTTQLVGTMTNPVIINSASYTHSFQCCCSHRYCQQVASNDYCAYTGLKVGQTGILAPSVNEHLNLIGRFMHITVE